MSRLTFQEKLLWAQLVGILAVVVYYAHYLLHSPPGHHYSHAIVVGLLLIFACVRLFVRRSGNVVEDERDRAVASLGDRWSNLILWAGLVLILVLYWDHGSLRSSASLVNILFHLLLLAAVARILRELVAYRQAA